MNWMIWIMAVAATICIRMLPKTFRYKEKKISTKSLVWMPILLATIITVADIVLPKIYLLLGWILWAVTGLIILLLVAYLIKKYGKKIGGSTWLSTLLKHASIAILIVVVINILFKYLTTIKPEIWQWYWNNQAFFWAWNIGWVIVIVLLTTKDEKGNILPIAFKSGKIVVYMLFAGMFLNLLFISVVPWWKNYEKEEKKQQSEERRGPAPVGGGFSFTPPYEGVKPLIRDPIEHLVNNLKGLGQPQSGESTSIEKAPVGEWGKLIVVPEGTKRVQLDDGANDTRKYSVRWNGMTEEDFPREEGVGPKTPSIVRGFQFKSRELDELEIIVKFEFE